jgi:hypothetical protein
MVSGKNGKNERRRVAVVSSHAPSILGRIDPTQVRRFRLDLADRTASVRSIKLPEGEVEALKFVREAVRTYPELYFARFTVLGEAITGTSWNGAFLSPRIIAAIVDGTAPTDLTVTGLAKALPYSWA